MKNPKLPAIPKPQKAKPLIHPKGDGVKTDMPPDLSYITPALRPFAVRTSDLAFLPNNPRTHEENIDQIRASLKELGQYAPVIVNQRKTPPVVIAGNGRLQAALSLNWEYIAAVYIDVDDATAAKIAVIDNRSGETGGWNAENLAQYLKMIDTIDKDLAGMLEKLAIEVKALTIPESEDPGAQIDQAAELQKKWKTKLGQLWTIPSKTVPGKSHRLLAGDSTKAEDVARVMVGEKAGLMNTDPPYGVEYSDEARVAAERAHGRPQRKTKWNEGIENDEVDGPKLQAFLEESIRTAVPHLLDNAAFYLWHPMLTQGTFFAAAAAADILIHRQIIWVKSAMLFGFGDYHWQHELCFYGWRRGNRPEFLGERNQTTIWDMRHDSSNGKREHPTQKPVELFAIPMRNHLKPGELAYEPFSGSGTQFVAGEQLGRLVYGLEIEPKYVAVCLERLAGMGLEPSLKT